MAGYRVTRMWTKDEFTVHPRCIFAVPDKSYGSRQSIEVVMSPRGVNVSPSMSGFSSSRISEKMRVRIHKMHLYENPQMGLGLRGFPPSEDQKIYNMEIVSLSSSFLNMTGIMIEATFVEEGMGIDDLLKVDLASVLGIREASYPIHLSGENVNHSKLIAEDTAIAWHLRDLLKAGKHREAMTALRKHFTGRKFNI